MAASARVNELSSPFLSINLADCGFFYLRLKLCLQVIKFNLSADLFRGFLEQLVSGFN
jgi:hypothetical protein